MTKKIFLFLAVAIVALSTLVSALTPMIDGKFDSTIYSSSTSMCDSVNRGGATVGNLYTYVDSNGDINIYYNQSTNVNDNTYGTGAIGWPSGHTFSALTGSDMAEFVFKDATGKVVLDFKVDYITAASVPSGYACLNVSGGDGGMILGNKSYILGAKTSLDYNFNNISCVYPVNSPPAYANYTPTPSSACPSWIYPDAYEIKVSKNAFGTAGFGSVEIALVHDSPPKDGKGNAVYPKPCTPIGPVCSNPMMMPSAAWSTEKPGGILSYVNKSDDHYAEQPSKGTIGYMYFNWTNIPNVYSIENLVFGVEHKEYKGVDTTIEIYNGTNWVSMCGLTYSTTDVTDHCDITSYKNENISIRLKVINTTHDEGKEKVDFVFLNIVHAEICNGIDDDCNGLIDDNLVAPSCLLQAGVCESSLKICGGSAGWLDCNATNYGPNYVVNETTAYCDLLDNDCDGDVDELCTCTPDGKNQSCGSDVGECVSGLSYCVFGQWGDCIGSLGPFTEICDGLDNDCNGQTDRNISGDNVCPPKHYYCDKDGDSYYSECPDGYCDTFNCQPPENCTFTKGNDCDDTNASKTLAGVCGCGIPDIDTDGDGTLDCIDGCPNDMNKTYPGVCGCGVLDVDSDYDGALDCIDQCPNDALKFAPGICGCGVSDVDSDNDGTPDCIDACPSDPNKFEDAGVCGCGVSDTDTDSDGTADCIDGCPNDMNKTSPGICGCGTLDTDSDNDGVADCFDNCPSDPNKNVPGVCGCGNPDTDSDNDGTPNCNDDCPNDMNKTSPGVCGCGVSDVDSDNDGTPDCIDACPSDPNKFEDAGVCGCGVSDTDTDSDGTADCIDGCPNDMNKTNPGICGCGVADTDSDNDGISDCNDNCIDVPNQDQADSDNDGIGDACDEPFCGNGIVETGEQCDDGNNNGGDGCSATCQSEQEEPIPEFSVIWVGVALVCGFVIFIFSRKEW